MQDLVTSGIRTITPYVVGAVVAWLTQKGVNVPQSSVASATAIVTFIVGSAYYGAVRALEHKYPKAGYLLGVPTKPTYGNS